MKKYIYLFILIFSISICYSQNNQNDIPAAEPKLPLFFIGGYVDYNYNIHNANFQSLSLDYFSCCPKYKIATGNGFALGLLFEKPLNNLINGFTVGTKLGYTDISANYAEVEIIGNVEVRDTEEPFETKLIDQAEVIHHIDTKLGMINFHPYVSYKFFNHFKGILGLNFGFLIKNSFSQYEELSKPDNLVFINGSKIRNKYDETDIPDINKFQFGIALGIGYELPIGKDAYIVPRISCNIGLTDIAAVDWKANNLKIGADIKFPIYRKDEPVKKELIYMRDTIIEKRFDIKGDYIALTETVEKDNIVYETYKYYKKTDAELEIDFEVYGIDEKNNITISKPKVVVEEFYTTESFPILPNIYFKDGSTDLNKTRLHLITKEEANSFDEKNINSFDALDVYYDLLNILGKRLKENRSTKIIIAGYSSEEGKDAENSKISLERANVVKDYLTNVWDIPDSRLIVEERKHSIRNINPSSIKDAVEEKSRVELIPLEEFSNSTFLLYKPVVLSHIERKTNPPCIGFKTNIKSEAGVDFYKLKAEQDNKTLYEVNLRADNFNHKWKIEDESVPNSNTPLNITLNVKDKIGQEKNVQHSLDIEQVTIQKKKERIEGDWLIEKYSLILFDFDDANISYLDTQILNEIKSNISKNSKVLISVSGYADRTGEKEYNKNLAKRRCDEVCKILDVKNAIINPIGNDELLFDNNLPEGRALSRTVRIEIRTPIK